MGRNLKSCVLLVAVGLACEAHAGDRRSSGTVQESARAMLVTPVKAAPVPGSGRDVSAFGLFETEYSVNQRSGRNREHGAEQARERKPLTLFRFNSKLGEVAVEPVIGKVNGAQFSLGF